MKKLFNYFKALLFPDLFEEDLRKSNRSSSSKFLDAKLVMQTPNGDSLEIPHAKKDMIMKAMKNVGMPIPDESSRGGHGFGLNLKDLSDKDEEFMNTLTDRLRDAENQEDFDRIFKKLKTVLDRSGGIVVEGSSKNEIEKNYRKALKGRNKHSFDGISKNGDRSILPDEMKQFFKEQFISETIKHFNTPILHRRVSDLPQAPFNSDAHIPKAMDIEEEREILIGNTILDEYINSGDVLRCSAAAFNLGLNYPETHFGGIFVGLLQAAEGVDANEITMTDDRINNFLGQEGLRKLRRIGLAYGMKKHLPHYDTNQFEMEMNKFLEI